MESMSSFSAALFLFPRIKDAIREHFHVRFLGSYFLDKKRMAFFLVLVIIA